MGSRCLCRLPQQTVHRDRAAWRIGYLSDPAEAAAMLPTHGSFTKTNRGDALWILLFAGVRHSLA